ncbi:MAG: hypothetical protein NTY03_08530 [Candidatus Bathyarchaeota archaeon]|nr:hypothetical protein [Candidatus Bathyarchaeota archaeon]
MTAILGIEIMQITQVAVTVVVTYIISWLISRILRGIFKKTHFPEQIESGLIRVAQIVVYLSGFFAIVSILGIDRQDFLAWR